MSFVTTATNPTPAQEPKIENDPWFPEVTPQDVRDACLLDGTVTVHRLRVAMLDAFDTVNRELSCYRDACEAQGHAKLADVPARQLGGMSVQVFRYRRAVFACVHALVAEAHRDIDTTPHSDGKEGRIREKIEAKIEEHRRTMRWAINDLLGVSRSTIELI